MKRYIEEEIEEGSQNYLNSLYNNNNINEELKQFLEPIEGNVFLNKNVHISSENLERYLELLSGSRDLKINNRNNIARNIIDFLERYIEMLNEYKDRFKEELSQKNNSKKNLPISKNMPSPPPTTNSYFYPKLKYENPKVTYSPNSQHKHYLHHKEEQKYKGISNYPNLVESYNIIKQKRHKHNQAWLEWIKNVPNPGANGVMSKAEFIWNRFQDVIDEEERWDNYKEEELRKRRSTPQLSKKEFLLKYPQKNVEDHYNRIKRNDRMARKEWMRKMKASEKK